MGTIAPRRTLGAKAYSARMRRPNCVDGGRELILLSAVVTIWSSAGHEGGRVRRG